MYVANYIQPESSRIKTEINAKEIAYDNILFRNRIIKNRDSSTWNGIKDTFALIITISSHHSTRLQGSNCPQKFSIQIIKMFVKVIFVTLFVATIDEAVIVSAIPQSNSLGHLELPGGTNLFQNIDFGNVPSLASIDKPAPANATTCTCAVFMSGQFKRGSSEQPSGFPALISEENHAYPCNPIGMKSCVNRCLESVS